MVNAQLNLAFDLVTHWNGINAQPNLDFDHVIRPDLFRFMPTSRGNLVLIIPASLLWAVLVSAVDVRVNMGRGMGWGGGGGWSA